MCQNLKKIFITVSFTEMDYVPGEEEQVKVENNACHQELDNLNFQKVDEV